MEPRIQYAQTADGVSIAFYTLGEGMPLVDLWPNPFSHIQLEWESPHWRRWYERIAKKRMLVRYDSRGCGLSDHDATDYSLEAHMRDLEAVVRHLNLETFALLGIMSGGPAAIAYAAREPGRVSHLALWCSWPRTSDYSRSTQAQGLSALLDKDWDLYLRTMMHAALGWSEPEEASRYAALVNEYLTPEALRAYFRAVEAWDVSGLLSQIKSPTLVIHRRRVPFPNVDVARGLASRIPTARLALLEGDSLAPYLGDMEAVTAAIDEFLSEGEKAAPAPATLAKQDIHTILFTDVEGSTALTQRLGDAKARDVLRGHERMVREALKSHGGSELKTMGDGFMASFSSATRALECAIAMQRAFAAHNQSAQEPILVRVGMNAGEPIAEEDPDGRGDLFGTAVIRAARIAAEAKGGEILVSNVVRELAEGKQFLFADRGEVALKGFDEPVRLYEVRWQEG